jgi:hypothetical protein
LHIHLQRYAGRLGTSTVGRGLGLAAERLYTHHWSKRFTFIAGVLYLAKLHVRAETKPCTSGGAPQLLPAPARPCAEARTCADERTAWMRSPTAGGTAGEQADSAAAPPEPRAASCAARRSVASSALRTSSVIICAAARAVSRDRSQRAARAAVPGEVGAFCASVTPAAAGLHCRDLPAGAGAPAPTGSLAPTSSITQQRLESRDRTSRRAEPQTRAAALYLQG